MSNTPERQCVDPALRRRRDPGRAFYGAAIIRREENSLAGCVERQVFRADDRPLHTFINNGDAPTVRRLEFRRAEIGFAACRSAQ